MCLCLIIAVLVFVDFRFRELAIIEECVAQYHSKDGENDTKRNNLNLVGDVHIVVLEEFDLHLIVSLLLHHVMDDVLCENKLSDG